MKKRTFKTTLFMVLKVLFHLNHATPLWFATTNLTVRSSAPPEDVYGHYILLPSRPGRSAADISCSELVFDRCTSGHAKANLSDCLCLRCSRIQHTMLDPQ